MPVIITARKDKFRRCGIVHSEQPTTYDTGRFTDKELARLKAEPMLLVQEVPDSGAIAKSPALDKMKLDELKALCDKLDIKYPEDATRKILIELVEKKTADPLKD